jgi:phosphoglycerol transferase
MLLPDAHHRIGRWADMRQQYDRWPLAGGENRGASLGVVGNLGFLFLLGLLLWRRGSNDSSSLLGALATLNISAVLLATIGGFGSLFSLLISPQIRCYNRISVFIALFSLFAAAIAFDRLAHWRANAGGRQWPLRVLLAAIVVAGIIDEAGRDRVPNYATHKADFDDDAEFVARIEAVVPTGSMVFQLPYFPFPESPAIVALGEYELFRPYLHSRSLRWSYGAMKGRDEDRWQRETCQRPTAELVKAIAERGFAGIYIDRRGYVDRAAALEAELTKLLGEVPLVSRNERMSFFALPVTMRQWPSAGETRAAVQKVRR